MIFQLSDWFPKPMIWAIIVKFDQIRKNWWRITCAEILEVGKIFFAASSVKKCHDLKRFHPKKSRELLENLLKQLFFSDLPDTSCYYPTSLCRVQITPKTSTNITRYLYSRGPVRQVFSQRASDEFDSSYEKKFCLSIGISFLRFFLTEISKWKTWIDL